MKYFPQKQDLAIACFILVITPALSFAWSGKVVSVTEGDTIKVMHKNKEEKIRLYGIDSPGEKQAFGQKAREFLSSFVTGEVVEVEPKEKDKFGRTVAMVSISDESVNGLMIDNGFAWVYPQNCKDKICDTWNKMQEAAKQGKKGMWAAPDNVPPWEFRSTKKTHVRKNHKKPAVTATKEEAKQEATN